MQAMSVKIDIPAYFQAFTGDAEAIEAKGSTVAECVNHLIEQFPAMKKMLLSEDGALLGDIGVYVNGEDAYPDELAKPVKDGDEIYLLYVIPGG